MARRKVGIFILMGICILLWSCGNQKKESPKLWAWSHAHTNYSDHQWDSLFAKMADHRIYGLLLSADSATLIRVIPLSEKHHIDVHAWMWAMNRGEAPKDWLSVNALGQSLADKKAYVDYYKFMCPALPEVREYIKSKVRGLTQIEGLKGVHLDYIRYVDVFLPVGLQPNYGLKQDSIMPQFDYGYHPFMRENFKQKFGKNPYDLPDMYTNPDWLQFRLDQVTEVVNSLPEITHAKNMELTAAVFPEPEMSVRMVRQEWSKWNLDAYFPMVYYNFYNEGPDWVGETISKCVKKLPGRKIYCGLYVPGIPTEEEFKRTINSAMENGASGIALFEIGSLKEFHWKILREIAFDSTQ
ncbi:MAG: hypothetical protein K9H64_08975 [Bacteroidales bacterium]|nr:hypothetical protein [Bacteroidales bacterium]MCF8455998.1 hypothetical protein [Bacteroidales bacterium]